MEGNIGNMERKVMEGTKVAVATSSARLRRDGAGRWSAAGIPVGQRVRSSCAPRHGRLSDWFRGGLRVAAAGGIGGVTRPEI